MHLSILRVEATTILALYLITQHTFSHIMHRTSPFVADRTHDVNKHVCRNNSNDIVLDVESNILQSFAVSFSLSK